MPSDSEPTPPPLSAALLNPRPVIAAGALLWALAAIAAFTIPALHSWRPITVAGLGVGGIRVVVIPVAARGGTARFAGRSDRYGPTPVNEGEP